jgi:multidrug efflux pump subunit AcrB
MNTPTHLHANSIQNKYGIVSWFLTNPIAANLLMALILVMGILTAIELRKEAFPAIAPNSVSISIPFPSGSAKAGEEGIAIKVEEALSVLQGVKRISTTSSAFDVNIEVIKKSKYDLDVLFRDVKNSIDAINTLPLQAEKPLISKAVWSEHAIWLQLFGDVDHDILQTLTDELTKKLLATKGINKVSAFGRLTPEISIEIDEKRLQAYNITLAEVAQKISRSSLIESGGELKSADGTIIVKADKQRFRQRDFESIILLQFKNGSKLTLGEVAKVNDSYLEEPILSRYNGAPSIALQVEMFGDSDVMTSATKAKEVVEAYRSRLPAQVSIATWYDQSTYIVERLSLMFKNSVQGILLVLILLAIFLNFRVAFWVAAGLPVAFAGALWAMGDGVAALTINELTTFGFIITLGIVVDDAVIVGESIHSAREKEPNITGALKGLHRVLIPATFGVLTTIVAFYSLTLVEGELGQLFSQFAIVGIFCLIFSLIETKLILPAHLAYVGESKKPVTKLAILWRAIQTSVAKGLKKFTFDIYQPALKTLLTYRYATLFSMFALFIVVVGLFNTGIIRFVFFPNIPSNVISINVLMDEGIGYGLTHKEALRIEREGLAVNKQLRKENDFSQDIIKHIQVRSTTVGEINIIAELIDRDVRPIPIGEITKRWKNKVGSIEGAGSIEFSSNWSGSDDIRIEIASGNEETLYLINEEIVAALSSISSVSNIKNTLKSSQRQVNLELNALGIAEGLTMADLSSQIQQNFQGYEVQRLQRGKDEIRVQVRYPKADRSHRDDLDKAKIRISSGKVLPLSSIATISLVDVDSEVTRVNRNKVTILTADVDKNVSSPNKILKQLEATLFSGLRSAYPEALIIIDGEAAEQKESLNSLVFAFALTLFGIFTLLAIPLKSYTQPLVVMLAIPFGVVGALLGHYICNIPVSILSLFGILALTGVVVNDSLLLISRFNELRDQGIETIEAICQSATGRMRAIILTSSTTFAGLAPLISETSEQAQFLIPAAVSLGYGILFATVITLILIPITLLISQDISFLFKRNKDETATHNVTLGDAI